MIGWVQGVLLQADEGTLLVNVNGVGYRLFAPDSSLRQIGNVGETVSLHVHTHVRDDAIQLFGFATQTELRLFETVVTVSGIGPRLGLTILSHLTPQAFSRAVMGGDVAVLVRVPGIGKKTAARIVLELKDKVAEFADGAPPLDSGPDESGWSAGGSDENDAVAALLALGYSEEEAKAAVADVAATHDGDGVQTLITAALRRLDRSN